MERGLTYEDIVLTIIVALLVALLVAYLYGMNEKLSKLITIVEKSFAKTERPFAEIKGMLERIFDKPSQDKHHAIDPEFKLEHLDINVDIEIRDISEKSVGISITFPSKEYIGEEGLTHTDEKINADYPGYAILHSHVLDTVFLRIRSSKREEFSPRICITIIKEYLKYFDKFYEKRKELEENFEKEFEP